MNPPNYEISFALGQYYGTDMISFGVKVPVSQVGEIVITNDNFSNYIITGFTDVGYGTVNGVNYSDGVTFQELLANLTDDVYQDWTIRVGNSGQGGNETSNQWIQSELNGKTLTHMVINVKTFTTSVGNSNQFGTFYNLSTDFDLEFYYEDTNPVCGNGVVDAGEDCDDGNLVNGDGCSTTCQAEVAFSVSADRYLPPPFTVTGVGFTPTSDDMSDMVGDHDGVWRVVQTTGATNTTSIIRVESVLTSGNDFRYDVYHVSGDPIAIPDAGTTAVFYHN